MNIDKQQVTKQVIAARSRFTSYLNSFLFLEGGGMAFANHKQETLHARVEALTALKDLNYYERLAGIPVSREKVPKSHYQEEQK